MKEGILPQMFCNYNQMCHIWTASINSEEVLLPVVFNSRKFLDESNIVGVQSLVGDEVVLGGGQPVTVDRQQVGIGHPEIRISKRGVLKPDYLLPVDDQSEQVAVVGVVGSLEKVALSEKEVEGREVDHVPLLPHHHAQVLQGHLQQYNDSKRRRLASPRGRSR